CFISRSFAFKPSTWYMALVYPHYFRTAISSTPGKIHPPTEFNGGKRTVFELWRRRAGLLFGDRSLLTLRQFEKTILPVEGIAYELALERALKALIHYAESPSQLLDFFESSDLPRSGLPNEFILQAAPASTGISSITDNK